MEVFIKNIFNLKAGLLALLIILPVTAGAIPITDLYNTGVDASGSLLGDNVADSNYSITAGGSYTATTVESGEGVLYSSHVWTPNNSQSRWIGPEGFNAMGPGSNTMTYRTSFTIGAGADLSTAFITGLIAADNGISVLLNGSSISGISGQFNVLNSFTIDSGFVAGTNTLDFLVYNAGGSLNPTGLRIDNISGNYGLVASVPEPAVLALMALGFAGIGFMRRRKKQ